MAWLHNDLMVGSLISLSIWLGCFVLHVTLPGQVVAGYCINPRTDKPLKYKLNGFSMLITSVAFFMFVPLEVKVLLYNRQKEVSMAACLLGFIISWCSYVYMMPCRESYERCLTTDQLYTRSVPNTLTNTLTNTSSRSPLSCIFRDFFLGHAFNPRFTYVHTNIHACIRTYVHTNIHTYMHAYINT